MLDRAGALTAILQALKQRGGELSARGNCPKRVRRRWSPGENLRRLPTGLTFFPSRTGQGGTPSGTLGVVHRAARGTLIDLSLCVFCYMRARTHTKEN